MSVSPEVEVHRLFEELPGVPRERDVTALEWLRDIVGRGLHSSTFRLNVSTSCWDRGCI